MSSRETGSGFNWRLVLAIGTPIAVSIAAVSIYIYYSRKRRKEESQDIDTSENTEKSEQSSASGSKQTHEKETNEEEVAALKWLAEKKAEANGCFKEKEYQRAAELYTQLIEECPPLEVLRNDIAKIYHNRAAAYENLQGEDCSTRIIEDCTKAINIDPKYAKARVRRAKALEAMDQVMPCLKDWTLVALLQPQLAETDPAYRRLDQLVSKKGQEISEEAMKTHRVLLPSKSSIEDFTNIFFDFELYTDANLLDLYREHTGVEAVPLKPVSSADPQLSNSAPENGLTSTGDSTDSSSENSASNLIGTETTETANHTPVDNGVGDTELMGRLETEPFWRVISLMRSRQYTRIVEFSSQAIATGCTVFRPYALLVRSIFYLILCEYTEALQDIKAILSNQNIPIQVRVGALLRRACVNEALGDYDDAIDNFREAQRIDPDNPSIFLVRSKFYASDDRPDLDKAQADINKCLELRPDHNLAGRCYCALLKYKLASTSQSMVDMEKVRRHLKETMNKFPDRPEPIAIYFQVLTDFQEIHEASQYLEKAIAMDPDNGMLHVYRSQCTLAIKGVNPHGLGSVNNPHMMEAVNEAIEQLEYAVKIDPQCGVAMEVLSTMYSQNGETARALDYLEKAIKLVRTKQEMASLQTFKLILTFQPEINKEMLVCGLDPIELQNSLTKLS